MEANYRYDFTKAIRKSCKHRTLSHILGCIFDSFCRRGNMGAYHLINAASIFSQAHDPSLCSL